MRVYSPENECVIFHGLSKSKAFWARGYYVTTVGNITEEAIKKYIQEQSEESRKEDSKGASF
jgi:REP element-mobilizing transposase RayT